MTKKELEEILHLRAEAKMWERALSKHQDKKLQEKIQEHLLKITQLENEIAEYVLTLQEPLIRDIIYMRYVEGLQWEDVAAKIGGGNTADSVRKIYARSRL